MEFKSYYTSFIRVPQDQGFRITPLLCNLEGSDSPVIVGAEQFTPLVRP